MLIELCQPVPLRQLCCVRPISPAMPKARTRQVTVSPCLFSCRDLWLLPPSSRYPRHRQTWRKAFNRQQPARLPSGPSPDEVICHLMQLVLRRGQTKPDSPNNMGDPFYLSLHAATLVRQQGATSHQKGHRRSRYTACPPLLAAKARSSAVLCYNLRALSGVDDQLAAVPLPEKGPLASYPRQWSTE